MFPRWEAYLDNRRAPLETSPEGLAAVGVPAGHHRIALELSLPPLPQVSLPISMLGVLIWALLYTRMHRTRWPRT